MTKKEAIRWLNKQIAIEILRKDAELFFGDDGTYYGIERCGVDKYNKVLIYARTEKEFYRLAEAIQATIKFNYRPEWDDVVASFKYKNFVFYTIMDVVLKGGCFNGN